MPIKITMPRLSDTMEEGTLVKWRVKEGDKVASGDILADVETDKATMELQSFDDGVVAKIALGEGEVAKVGGLILVLAEEGEDPAQAAKVASENASGDSPKAADKKPQASAKAESQDKPAQAEEKQQQAANQDEDDNSDAGSGKLRVSPLARRIAEDQGIDLGTIKGSGPDGRIIKRDVLAAAEGKAVAPASAGGGSGSASASAKAPAPVPPQPTLESKTIPVNNMRKTIARRLLESKTTIPHFTVTVQADVGELGKLRATLNKQLASQGVKLSVNDFIVRAAALALLQHPVINSSWTDAGIQQHGSVNIGVAVALPEEKGGGLVVPVLHGTHTMGLRQISQQTRQLADKARTKGLSVEEMSDGTFTLSNLGPWNVDHFEAIINPPQSAILAIGAAIEQPVVKDGQIVIGSRMSLTLSADHRVIDGATAAVFVNTVKDLLENPATLLV